MYKDFSNDAKCSDSNKTMPFKAIDNKLLTNYTKIVSSLMDIQFDSGPVYDNNDK